MTIKLFFCQTGYVVLFMQFSTHNGMDSVKVYEFKADKFTSLVTAV
jgi:hypothetical protein